MKTGSGPYSLEDLREELAEFVREREWEQFHSAKNLAMGVSIEAAELLELFQWLSSEESNQPAPDLLARLEEEIGDVLIYLVLLSRRVGIDPLAAGQKKLERNRSKYPAEKARGRREKYDEL